jgi:hypothetical protein
MNGPALVKVEFENDAVRERAAGLTSYTRDILPSGRCCWIVPLENLSKIAQELAGEGFTVKGHLEVYG